SCVKERVGFETETGSRRCSKREETWNWQENLTLKVNRTGKPMPSTCSVRDLVRFQVTTAALQSLESIDLSHNRVLFLDAVTIKANKRLRTIDLSHNHIHYINSVFVNLPDLRELFLSENNILEVPKDAFTNSVMLTVIYLQQNAVRRIDEEALTSLTSLTQLFLSENFIEYFPCNLLNGSTQLFSLSLDGNWIQGLQPGTFQRVNELKELRLQNNRITKIERGVFEPLPNLLELHLHNNLITTIDSRAFQSLQSLQHNLGEHHLLGGSQVADSDTSIRYAVPDRGGSINRAWWGDLWRGHNYQIPQSPGLVPQRLGEGGSDLKPWLDQDLRRRLQNQTPGPPGWGLSIGLTTQSHKKTPKDAGRISRRRPRRVNKVMRRDTDIYFGSWNVQTLLKAGKMEEVAQELEKYKTSIGAVQEVRWKDSGTIKKRNYDFHFSGSNNVRGHKGVGFLCCEELGKRY
ncbi:hypothetical protein J6590_087281, partial [Homalodisca vitripennis]